jgi:hypothetical protein
MKRDRGAYVGVPFRLSWPAIFGGLAAAFGLWLLLYVLGLALGFSSLDFERPNLLRALGIGGGLWVALSGFASMFVGGLVTARSAGYLGRGNGALHGIVLWGATEFILCAVSLALVGTAATQLTQAGSDAATRLAGSVDIDSRELLAPVNARLQQAGKPTLRPEQVERVTRDALTTAVQRGSFDREAFVRIVADDTDLSQADVRQIMGRSLSDAQAKLDQLRRQATQAADEAASITARALWGGFVLLITSLLGALLGASTGVSRQQREMYAPRGEEHVVLPHHTESYR